MRWRERSCRRTSSGLLKTPKWEKPLGRLVYDLTEIDNDTGNHWRHAWPPQYRSRQLANPDCIQRKVLITPTGVDKN